MKRVHTTKGIADAVALEARLEAEGLHATVEEDNVAGIAFIPDLAGTYGVYVVNGEDYDAATQCVAEFLADDGNGAGDRWICDGCGEVLEAQFASCWNCDMERGPSATLVAKDEAPTEDEYALEKGNRRKLASRWARLGGSLIDGIIGMALYVPAAIQLGLLNFDRQAKDEPWTIQMTILSIVLDLVFFFIVHGYLLATRGQTIGKIVCGTRIVDAEGRVPSILKLAVMRYASIHILSCAPFVGESVVWIDSLMIFGKERRCLHDRLAGTWVERVSVDENPVVRTAGEVWSRVRGTSSTNRLSRTGVITISVTLLFIALTIASGLMVWSSYKAGLETRARVAMLRKKQARVTMLRQSVSAWNEWRDGDINRSFMLAGPLQGSLEIERLLYRLDLEGADLTGVHLGGADLRWVDLTGANLEGIRGWKSAHFRGTNICDVKNAPENFVEFARSQGAVDAPPFAVPPEE